MVVIKRDDGIFGVSGDVNHLCIGHLFPVESSRRKVKLTLEVSSNLG
jgi:hypothetical protein